MLKVQFLIIAPFEVHMSTVRGLLQGWCVPI